MLVTLSFTFHRWTLDQYNITADAVIHFTPMHKTLKVQLPDLRYIDCTIDFSIKTFNASINLCKELGKDLPYTITYYCHNNGLVTR